MMNQVLVQSRMCRFVAVLASLSLVSVAAAQFPFPELPKGADTNEFSMRVKVVDAASNKALGGVPVQVPMLTPGPGRPSSNQWQFVTDTQGVAALRLPGYVVAFNYFFLSVSNAGYPVRHVSWQRQPAGGGTVGAIREVLPAEYTVRLERWRSIGGFVKDEKGRPLKDVRVVAWGTGSAAYTFSNDGSAREYSALNREDRLGVTSDAQGFWRIDEYPPDIVRVSLDVIRPDGSRSQFVTPSPDPRFPTEPGEPVEMTALLATNAVLELKEGVTIRGVVVDEAGQPIPGAVVRDRSGASWGNQTSVTTNDAAGRFVLPHRTGVQYIVTAQAAGYAISSALVTPSADAPELKIVLSLAQPLRLRLVDESGKPVVRAVVSAPEYRNPGDIQEWNASSDEAGRVVWTNAPRKTLSVAISSTNGQIRMARLESSASEHVVTVRREASKSIGFQLRAVDAETRQPVPVFSVWKDIPPSGPGKEPGWRTTNGLVKGELSRTDFREGWSTSFRLQVRADGYQTWRSVSVDFEEGDFELTAQLVRGKAPSGLVQQPNGEPAADARVFAVPSSETLFLYSPQNFFEDVSLRTGMIRVKAGPDGRFVLEDLGEGFNVVVLHRSGFAVAGLKELSEKSAVKLAPYATLKGVIRAGGQPLPRERVSIRSPVVWEGNDGYQVSLSATTDAAGRFTFTNVPPGDYLLCRYPVSISGHTVEESHRLVVTLNGGETRDVDYSFNGRTVVGQVDADGEVDWRNDHHLLVAKMPPAPPGPNYYAYADPESYQKARRAHGRSPAVLDYERKRQQFELMFDKDGGFKVEDVPPGRYELRISATKPVKGNSRNRFERSQEVLGAIKREVVIPAGKPGELFDLGTFTMEVKESPGVRTPPVDFTADQLDGRPFTLSSLRGRPVVVCFWAGWAPGSEKFIENVRASIASLTGNQKPALVTVNVDTRTDGIGEGVKSLGAGWVHTRLPGAALASVTEQWKIETVPTLVLLDTEGRVKTRDVEIKRLASSVKRLMAAKN